MQPDLFKIKTFIKPFERVLALRELSALSGGEIFPIDGDEATATTFAASPPVDVSVVGRSLAYWYSAGGEGDYTNQLRREATSVIARNGLAIDDIPAKVRSLIPTKLPNSRCLRYATHGIHEYRGKFFPQLVKSLINIANVPKDGIVIDPMCGSGTTLVEAKLAGINSAGLDMNPLSVFISSVKCSALEIEARDLISTYNFLKENLYRVAQRGKQDYSLKLHTADQAYLERWFEASTLVELDAISAALDEIDDKRIQDFFRVCLSNIIRWSSLQKEADLRVRREPKKLSVGEVLDRFLVEALRSTKLVAAFLTENAGSLVGQHYVADGDARKHDVFLKKYVDRVDAIITSPPYATALPYLDTDRLNLIYLGLLPRTNHRERDLNMIGNREVSERQRRETWEMYETKRGHLPHSVQVLIDRVEKLNSQTTVGFRRRNLGSLLAKYFLDMKDVMTSAHRMLHKGGTMFMVVGNNRTVAGGDSIEINTADLLTDIGEASGYRITDSMPMDMLVSRDIFRGNAMASERIFAMRKVQ